MSLPIIQTIQNNINSLNSSKLDIKNAVNTDYDFIANEQIESYPSLIKQGIAHYKNRVPHATKEGTDFSFDAVPLKFENMTIKGDTSQATRILPEGYTQLDYIESTGTQYIDTGYIPLDTDTFSIEVYPIDYNPFFGATNFTTARANNNQDYFRIFDNSGTPSGALTLNTWQTGIYNGTTKIFKMHNNSINARNVAATSNLWLFGRSDTQQLGMSRIRSFKVEGKFNLIPCYRNSDNEIGMYDLINDAFYINDGTDDFIAGNEVSIPNPDYPQPIHVVIGNNTIGVQGKNLFEKNTQNIIAGTFEAGSTTIQAATYSRIAYMPIKSNTTYTIQKIINAGANRFRLATSEAIPTTGVEIHNVAISDNTTSRTITNISDNYLLILYSQTNQTTTPQEEILASIQVEEGSTATSYEPYYHADYPINLGSIELCKIGDYQDYIYKDGDNWYIQKNTKKTILDKPTTGNLNTDYTYNYFSYRGEPSEIYQGTNIICSHFIGAYNVPDMRTKAQYNNSIFLGSNATFVRVDKFNTVEEYINALSADDITIIGRKKTPTTTQITDQTLIAQLNAIDKAKGVDGTTIITIDSDDLKPILNFTAYLKEVE